MSIIIGGHESGVLDSSNALLNRDDNSRIGDTGHGEQLYSNVSNGNLILQQRDAYIPSLGDDFELVRTYNSNGLENGMGGMGGAGLRGGMDSAGNLGGWRLSTNITITKIHHSEVHAPGEFIYEVTYGDGSTFQFIYDAVKDLWVSTDGAGAYETIQILGKDKAADPTANVQADANLLDKAVVFVLTRADQSQYMFDKFGRLLSIVDTNNVRMDFEYDKKNLVKVYDDQGHLFNFIYYNDHQVHHHGNLAQITDETSGVLVSYDYDKFGRLTTVTDRDGHVTNYIYNNYGLLQSISLPNTQLVNGVQEVYQNREIKFDYQEVQWYDHNYANLQNVGGNSDRSLIVSKITDAEGGETSFEYKFEFSNPKPFADQSNGNGANAGNGNAGGNGGGNGGVNNGNQTKFYREFLGGNTIVVDALGNNRAFSNDQQYVDWRIANGYYATYNVNDLTLANQTKAIRDQHSLVYNYDKHGYITEVVDQQGFHATYAYNANNDFISTTDRNGWGATQSDSDYYRALRAELGYVDASGLGKKVAELSLAEITEILSRFTSTFTYDDRGNLLSSKDNAGHEITFTYATFNKITSMTSAMGNALVSSNEAQYLEKRAELGYVDAAGNGKAAEALLPNEVAAILALYTTTFDYDANQNLIKRVDAGGDVTTYEYDIYGNRTKQIVYLDANDPLNPAKQQVTQFIYDAFGNNIETIDAKQSHTFNEFDHFGNLIRHTDANGGITTYTYDDDNRLLTITDPEGHVTANTYDAVGNRISVTDANQHTVTYIYDRNNMLLAKIDPSVDGPAKDRVTEYTYDVIGNNTKIIDAEKRETNYVFNSRRQLVEIITPQVKDANGVLRTYSSTISYDGEGNRIRVTNNEQHSTDYLYTQDGLLKQETDAIGHITRFTYDANHNQVMVVAGVQLAVALRQVIKFRYDEENQRIAVTDAEGGVTSFDYDAVGNLITIVDANGHALANDDSAWAQQKRAELGFIRADGSGKLAAELSVAERAALLQMYTTNFEFDLLNRKVKEIKPEVIDPKTGAPTRYQIVTDYDANSNIIAVTDQNNHTTHFKFDKDDRMVMVVDANGVNTVFQYDSRHNRTMAAIGATATYDEITKHVTFSESDGDQVTTYGYDEFNQRISVTDGVGNALMTSDLALYREMRKDMGLLDVNDPTQGKAAGALAPGELAFIKNAYTNYFTFDRVGNNTSITDHEGRTTVDEFDALNRVVSRTNALGGKVTFGFDGNGNQVKSTDEVGYALVSSNDAYYADKRVELGFARDVMALSAADKTTILDLYTSESTFDAVDRLVTSTDAKNIVSENVYDDFGNITSVVRAKGTVDERVSQFIYDLNNRLTSQFVDPAGLNLNSSFEYDAVGNRLRVIDARGNASKYVYDALNRNIKIIDPLSFETKYEFDGVGNRLSIIDARGAISRFDYDPGNRLAKTTDAEGRVTTYEFDVRGNRIAVTDGVGNALLTSNDPDMLALRRQHNIVNADGSAKSVAQLTAQDVATLKALHTTKYDYDAENNLRSITDAQGNVSTQKFDRVYNVVSSTDKNGNTTHFAFDALNRMIEKVDAEGNKTGYVFDAIGNQISVVEANGYAAISSDDPYYVNIRNSLNISLTAAELALDINKAAREAILEHFTTHYSYDSKNQRIAAIGADDMVTMYGYDAVGNQVEITNAYGTAEYQTTTFKFDKADRLISSTDAIGNGLVTNDSLEYQALRVSLGYAASLADLLANPVAVDQLLEMYTSHTIYDQNGNAVRTIDNLDRVTEYSYDADNRVKTIVDPIGVGLAESASNDYSALRVELGYPAAVPTDPALISQLKALYTTEYAYDAVGNRIQVKDALGHTTNTFYNLDGEVSHTVDAEGTITRFEYDQNGNQISATIYATPYAQPYLGIAAADMEIKPVPAVDSKHDQTTHFQFDSLNRMVHRVDAEGYVTSSVYDAAGNVRESIAYANAINYDGSLTIEDQLPLVDGKDRHSYLKYDAVNRLLSKIDAEDYLTTYDYDAVGNRIVERRYEGKTASHTLPLNQIKHQRSDYVFDDMNRLVSETVLISTNNGNEVSTTTAYQYDLIGNQTAKTYAAGVQGQEVTWHYRYDDMNRMVEEIDPYQTVTKHVYDSVGQSVVDYQAFGLADQIKTTKEYDGVGRMIRETKVATDNPDPLMQPVEQVVTEWKYDALGNIVLKTDAANSNDIRYTTFQYDKLNRVTVKTLADNNTDPNTIADGTTDALSTGYSYDAFGNQLTMVLGIGLPSERVESFAYDKLNHKIARTDGNNITTLFDYNAFGNMTHRYVTDISINWNIDTFAGVVSGAQLTQRIEYDGRDMQVIIYSGDGVSLDKQVIKREYDAAGNLVAQIDGYGSLDVATTQYVYDLANRVTDVIIDPNGINIHSKLEYDLRGNKISESTLKDAATGEWAVYRNEFDDLNRITLQTNALGYSTRTNYDVFGNQIEVTTGLYLPAVGDPNYNANLAANAKPETTRYAYDDLQRQIYKVDANGVVTQIGYDDRGNRTSLTLAVGHLDAGKAIDAANFTALADTETRVRQFVYDKADRLKSDMAMAGVGVSTPIITAYEYNELGELASKTEDAGGVNAVTRYFYDGGGRLQMLVNPINVVTHNEYDMRDNLVRETTGIPLLLDANGRPSVAVTPAMDVRVKSFAFDAAGRQISETVDPDGLAYTTVYHYDERGNRTQVIDANKNATDYFYDANNRQVWMRNAEGYLSKTEYDGIGNKTKEIQFAANAKNLSVTQFPAALSADDHVTRYVYDAVNNLVQMTDAEGGVTNYSYDALKNRKSIVSANGNAVIASNQAAYQELRAHFGYAKDLALLTQADKDALLNLFTTKYDYDALNQLIAEINIHRVNGVNQQVVTQFNYDAVGNKTDVIHNAGSSDQQHTTYVFDKANRQVAVTDAIGNALLENASAEYDALRAQILGLGAPVTLADLAANPGYADALRASHTSTKEYDGLDRLRFATDNLGRVSENTYDAAGRMTQTYNVSMANEQFQLLTTSDAIEYQQLRVSRGLPALVANLNLTQAGLDALRAELGEEYSVKFKYDSVGNRTQVIQSPGGVSEQIVTTYYDASNQSVMTIDAAGAVSEYEYDHIGNTTKITKYDELYKGVIDSTVKPAISPSILGLDQVSYYQYDGLSRVTHSLDGEQYMVVTHYDAFGNVVNTHAYANRLDTYSAATTLSAQLPLENALKDRVVDMRYDNNNNLIKHTDAEGYSIEYVYDALNNRVAMIDAIAYGTAHSVAPEFEQIRFDKGYIDQATGKALTPNALTADQVAAIKAERTSYYIYDDMNRIVNEINAMGFETRYEFDAVGNRSRVLEAYGSADQVEKRYTYDANNRLISDVRFVNANDQQGIVTLNVYDAAGQVIGKYEAYGHVSDDGLGKQRYTKSEYDAAGHIIKTTEAAGEPEQFVTSFFYDAHGNLIKQVDAVGDAEYQRETNYFYDKNNRVEFEIKQVDKHIAGQPDKTVVNHFEYDAFGNRERETVGAGLGLNDKTTFIAENSTLYIFDKKNLKKEVVATFNDDNVAGSQSKFIYNAFGEKEFSQQAINTQWSRTTQYNYDRKGQISYVIDPENGRTDYVYDAIGNQVKVIDGNNNARINTFDVLGRSLTSLSAGGKLTTNVYDARNNIIATTQSGADGVTDAQTVHYQFDNLNRQIRVTDGEGYFTSIEYDRFGNQIKVTNGSYVVDPNLSKNENDAKMLLAKETSNWFKFDARNRMVAMTDGMGYVTRYGYDIYGNRNSTLDSIGVGLTESDDQEFQDMRVARGYAAKLVDLSTADLDALRNSHLTVDVYDRQGRLLSSTTPEGGVTTYTYDAQNHVRSETNANGNAIVSSNDVVYQDKRQALGFARNVADLQPSDITLLLSYFTTVNDYYKDGKLKSETVKMFQEDTQQFVDVRTEHYYDAAGNEIKTIWAAGSADERVVEMTYDANNRKTQDISGDMLTQYQYDKMGNRTHVIQVIKDINNPDITKRNDVIARNEARYYFDKNNHLIAILDPMGYVTSFTYDSNGNKLEERVLMNKFTGIADQLLQDPATLENLKSGTDRVSTFVYDANNRIILETAANGSVTESIYNSAGNVSVQNTYANMDQYKAGNIKRSYGYEYDANNRVKLVTDSFELKAATATDKAVLDTTVTEYGYDAANNTIDVKISNAADVDNTLRWTHYSYDNNNREIRQEYVIADAAGNLNLGYSENIVQATKYDLLANVLQKTKGRGAAIDLSNSYRYDVNNKVVAEINGVGATIVYEYDNRGNVSRQIDSVGVELLSQNGLSVAAKADILNRHSTLFTYNSNNQKISETGPLVAIYASKVGSVEVHAYQEWSYDAAGNEVQHKVLQNVGQTTGAEQYQVTTSYYNANNKLVAQLDAFNTLREYDYNATGDKVDEIVYMDRLHDTDHDPAKRPNPPVNTLGVRHTTYHYDAAGRVQNIEYPEVEISKLNVVNTSNITVSPGQVLRPVESHVFDHFGNDVVTVGRGDNNSPSYYDNNVTLSYYDNKDRLIAQIDNAGYMIEWVYDAQDKVLAQKSHTGVYSNAEIQALRVALEANAAAGIRTEVPLPAPGEVITIYRQYDEAGRLIQETTPAVNIYDITKSAATNINTPSKSSAVTKFKYDANDNVIKKTLAYNTALESSEYYYFDNANRRVAVVNSDRVLHYYGFDAVGNMTQQTRYYTRVAASVNLDNIVLNNGALDNTVAMSVFGVADVSVSDQTKVMAYNALNQQTFEAELMWNGESKKIEQYTHNFKYDLAGNRTYSENEIGDVTEVVYNALNLPLLTIKSDGSTTGTGYDAVGNQTLGYTGSVPANETVSIDESSIGVALDGASHSMAINWTVPTQVSSWDASNPNPNATGNNDKFLLTMNSYIVYSNTSHAAGNLNNYEYSSSYAGSTTGGPAKVNIPLPSGDSKLYFRVVTQDLAGNVSWSREYAFTTPPYIADINAGYVDQAGSPALVVNAKFDGSAQSPTLIYTTTAGTSNSVVMTSMANGYYSANVSDASQAQGANYQIQWQDTAGTTYLSETRTQAAMGASTSSTSSIAVYSENPVNTASAKVIITTNVPANLNVNSVVAKWRERTSTLGYYQTANVVSMGGNGPESTLTLGVTDLERLKADTEYEILLTGVTASGEVSLGGFLYTPDYANVISKQNLSWETPPLGDAQVALVNGKRNGSLSVNGGVAVDLASGLVNGNNRLDLLYGNKSAATHTSTFTSTLIQVQDTDVDGNPLFDANGNPVMISLGYDMTAKVVGLKDDEFRAASDPAGAPNLFIAWRAAGSGVDFANSKPFSLDASGNYTVALPRFVNAGNYDFKVFYTSASGKQVVVDWYRANTSTTTFDLKNQFSTEIIAQELNANIAYNATSGDVSSTAGAYSGAIATAAFHAHLNVAHSLIGGNASKNANKDKQDTGYFTETFYNSLDAVIAEVKGEGGLYSEYKVDANGNAVATFNWGTKANAATKIEANARISYAEYDGRNRKVTQYDPAFTSSDKFGVLNAGLDHPVTLYRYDFQDNMTLESDRNHPFDLTTGKRMEYSALGKLTREYYLDHGTVVQDTYYGYDIRGNEVAVINTDGTEYRGELKSYDHNDQLIKEQKGLVASEASTTEYGYDAFGRKTSITNYLGSSYAYYDQRNRLVKTQQAYDVISGVPTYQYTYYRYDKRDNRIETIDPRLDLNIDLNNMSQTDIDALNNTKYKVVQEYDSQNRVVGTITNQTVDGITKVIYETRKYDVFGNMIEESSGLKAVNGAQGQFDTNEAVETKRHVYGDFGRMLMEVDAGGVQTVKAYNAFGNVEFEYDPTETIGQLTGRSTKMVEKRYDEAGNVIRIVDHATGTTTNYGYDIAGNRVYEHIDTSYNNTAVARTYSYEYDSRGNMTLWDETTGSQMRLQYFYDFAGNLRHTWTSTKTENGSPVDPAKFVNNWYYYDSANRVSKITATNVTDKTNQVVGSYTYDAAGNRKTVTTEANTLITYGYYSNGRLKSGAYYNDEGKLFGQTWTYDGAGNTVSYKEYNASLGVADPVTNIQEVIVGTSISEDQYKYSENNKNWYSHTGIGKAAADQSVSTYTFNAAGRTTRMVQTQDGSSYTYDYSYFADGREMSIKGYGDASGNSSSSYDVNLNRTEINLGKGNGSQTEFAKFAYDGENHIVQKYHENSDAAKETIDYFYANGNPVGEKGNYIKGGAKVLLDEGKYNLVQQINDSNPGTSVSSYTANDGDTLQNIAAAMYGNASLWYIIAEANGLDPNATVKAGTHLQIPNTVESGRLTSDAHKLYNDSDIIGSTLPNLETPQPSGGGGDSCASIVMTIIVVVIAVVAAMFVGPLALGILGAAGLGAGIVAVTLAYAVAGAIVYAAANIVQQGLFIALGYQDSFDWNQVGSAAVSGAFTGAASGFAALGQAGQISSTYAKIASASAKVLATASKQYMENGKITSWTSLASAAISGATSANYIKGADGAVTVVSETVDTVGKVAEYVTPWLQLAETYIRNDGELTPTDWAGAVGGTLSAAVGQNSEALEKLTGINDVGQRLLANAVVAGALSQFDKEAAKQYMFDAIGNEIGSAIGSDITSEIAKSDFYKDYQAKLAKFDKLPGVAEDSVDVSDEYDTSDDEFYDEAGNEQALAELAKKEAEAAKEPEITSREIKSGDSLWNIAKEQLGPDATDADILKQTQILMQLNPDLDPRNLQVGYNLNLVEPGLDIPISSDTLDAYNKSDAEYQNYVAEQKALDQEFEDAMRQFDELDQTAGVTGAPTDGNTAGDVLSQGDAEARLYRAKATSGTQASELDPLYNDLQQGFDNILTDYQASEAEKQRLWDEKNVFEKAYAVGEGVVVGTYEGVKGAVELGIDGVVALVENGKDLADFGAGLAADLAKGDYESVQAKLENVVNNLGDKLDALGETGKAMLKGVQTMMTIMQDEKARGLVADFIGKMWDATSTQTIAVGATSLVVDILLAVGTGGASAAAKAVGTGAKIAGTAAKLAESIANVGAKLSKLASKLGEKVEGVAAKVSGVVKKGAKEVDGVAEARKACFVAGTVVLTDKGLKAIEKLTIGEKVLAKNEFNGKIEYKQVLDTMIRHDKEIYRVIVENVSGDQAVIRSSDSHPFWVKDNGWVQAVELQAGDILIDAEGLEIQVVSQEMESGTATVYNIEVDDFHTYFVSDLNVFVHNADCNKLENVAQAARGERSTPLEGGNGSSGSGSNRIAAIRSALSDENRKLVSKEEREGLKFTIRRVEENGYELKGAVKYNGNQGIDLEFEGTGINAGRTALAEAKRSKSLGSLKTDTQGIRQGTRDFNLDRAAKADRPDLVQAINQGQVDMFVGLQRSERLVQINPAHGTIRNFRTAFPRQATDVILNNGRQAGRSANITPNTAPRSRI